MLAPPHTPIIDVVDLLPKIDAHLIDLLKSLSDSDWHKPSIAKLWNVKDIAAHLLDGNIRILSMLRDQYFGVEAPAAHRAALITYLNGLNADWVQAMKRVSPQLLILLHEMTGPQVCAYFKTLDPLGKSVFAVDWAGETESQNWMATAREYTEKWLHQQQIREAVNKPALMTRALYYPMIDIFMMALPHTYKNVDAADGTLLKLTIPSEIGGSWFLLRHWGQWKLLRHVVQIPDAELIIDADTSWKLFSKSLSPDQVKDKVQLLGHEKLAQVALSMISVMA